jgi:NADH-quinone oxidoreductase subunit K
VTPEHLGGVQVLAALLFLIGAAGLLLRRNALLVLLSVELMLNAAALALVGFARTRADEHGQVLALLVAAIGVAEGGVGLALVIGLVRSRGGVDVQDLGSLKW